MLHSLPNFEKIENGWQCGKFWQGDWKSMQIWPILKRKLKSMKKWPILRRRLKNYENLVTCDKETEKVWKYGLWGSRRFYQVMKFIIAPMCSIRKNLKISECATFAKVQRSPMCTIYEVEGSEEEGFDDLEWFTRISYFFCLVPKIHGSDVQL